MWAIVKKTEKGFETSVINKDFKQPTREEQAEFVHEFARSVLRVTHVFTATTSDTIEFKLTACTKEV